MAQKKVLQPASESERETNPIPKNRITNKTALVDARNIARAFPRP